jgi:hypothetical protein
MNRAGFIAAAATFPMIPLNALAEGEGFAFDQITDVFSPTTFAQCEPGDFVSEWNDYTPPGPEAGPDASRRWQARAMSLFGVAERHYVSATKWRSQALGGQPDRIVDYGARTVTTIEHRSRSYRVEPLEEHPSGRNAYARSVLALFGSSALTVSSEDIGERQVYGYPARGYRYQAKITSASDGHKRDWVVTVKKYLSPYPRTRSSVDGVPVIIPYGYSSSLDMADTLILAASTGELGSTVTFSGPPIPLTLSYYEAVDGLALNLSGVGARAVRRGNFRPISDDDPAFSVPSGYTRSL